MFECESLLPSSKYPSRILTINKLNDIIPIHFYVQDLRLKNLKMRRSLLHPQHIYAFT